MPLILPCRVLRQIFFCLKYIIDVMLALFFLVTVFSLVGEQLNECTLILNAQVTSSLLTSILQ